MSKKIQKNFQNKNKNSGNLLSDIKQACEGLIYVSETDAPVIAFCGTAAEDVTGKIIIQQIGGKSEEQIEEISFDLFFSHLTEIKEWFGGKQKARAKKFLDLQRLLKERLRKKKVFRIGKLRMDIYVVGLDENSCLIGVTTRIVET